MEENKVNKSEQIWSQVFLVLPIIICMNIGRDFSDNESMRIIYSGLFAGLGGVLGFGAQQSFKNKSLKVKIIGLISVMVLCGGIGFIASMLSENKPEKNEAVTIDNNWVKQKIGMLEFESPRKLISQTVEIPKSTEWFYKEMEMYSDNGEDRVTSFIKSKINIDTLEVIDAFSVSLESMLNKIKVDVKSAEFEVYMADDEEVSAMFSFQLNGKVVHGFGLMFLQDNSLESIWLLPIKKGFSKEYIEKFRYAIFTPSDLDLNEE